MILYEFTYRFFIIVAKNRLFFPDLELRKVHVTQTSCPAQAARFYTEILHCDRLVNSVSVTRRCHFVDLKETPELGQRSSQPNKTESIGTGKTNFTLFHQDRGLA